MLKGSVLGVVLAAAPVLMGGVKANVLINAPKGLGVMVRLSDPAPKGKVKVGAYQNGGAASEERQLSRNADRALMGEQRNLMLEFLDDFDLTLEFAVVETVKSPTPGLDPKVTVKGPLYHVRVAKGQGKEGFKVTDAEWMPKTDPRAKVVVDPLPFNPSQPNEHFLFRLQFPPVP